MCFIPWRKQASIRICCWSPSNTNSKSGQFDLQFLQSASSQSPLTVHQQRDRCRPPMKRWWCQNMPDTQVNTSNITCVCISYSWDQISPGWAVKASENVPQRHKLTSTSIIYFPSNKAFHNFYCTDTDLFAVNYTPTNSGRYNMALTPTRHHPQWWTIFRQTI